MTLTAGYRDMDTSQQPWCFGFRVLLNPDSHAVLHTACLLVATTLLITATLAWRTWYCRVSNTSKAAFKHAAPACVPTTLPEQQEASRLSLLGLPTPTNQEQQKVHSPLPEWFGHYASSSPSSDHACSISNHEMLGTPQQQVLMRRPPLYSTIPANVGQKLLLVIDADTDGHQVVAGVLSALAEYDMHCCQSGEEALVLLKQWDHLPDVVLLEMGLPGEQGVEVCRHIRQSYSRVELPIIMLSPEHPTEEDTQAALQAGVNDFLVKPLRQGLLLARLSAHILLPKLVASEVDRQHNYALLETMLPPRIISRLKSSCGVIAEQHSQVTILFSDICNFTELCSESPTVFVITMLNELFTRFDAASDKHGVYKVETIGDAYMAVCGHDSDSPDHAVRMMAMATDMLQAVQAVSTTMGQQLQIRVGMHTGPAFSGVVGIKCPRYCFFGDTVNTASRMESLGFPMCIHYSHSTKQALDRGYACMSGTEDAAAMACPGHVCCGERAVKGKRDKMTTYCAQVGDFKQALAQLGISSAGAETMAQHAADQASCERGVSPACYVPIDAQPFQLNKLEYNMQAWKQAIGGLYGVQMPHANAAPAPKGSRSLSSNGSLLPCWHIIGPTASVDWSDWRQSLPSLDAQQQQSNPTAPPLPPAHELVHLPAVQLVPLVVTRPHGGAAGPIAPLTPSCDDMVTAAAKGDWDDDSANESSRTNSPYDVQRSTFGGSHCQRQEDRDCLQWAVHPDTGAEQQSCPDNIVDAQQSPDAAEPHGHCTNYRRSLTAGSDTRRDGCSHNGAVLMTAERRVHRPHHYHLAQDSRSLRRWGSVGEGLAGTVAATAAAAAHVDGAASSKRSQSCSGMHCTGAHCSRTSHASSSARVRSGRRHTVPGHLSQGGHASWSVHDELMMVVEAHLSSNQALMQRCASPNGLGCLEL